MSLKPLARSVGGIVLALGLATSAAAQPPYELTPEQARDLMQKLDRNLRFGLPSLPHGQPFFRMIRLDTEFVPKKDNASLPISNYDAARQSFAAALPDGQVEAIHVYLKQAAGGPSSLYDVTLELYESSVHDPIVPKMTLLASATTKVVNTSMLAQSKWVIFELNKAVKSWSDRQFVIVLGAAAPPNVYSWVGDDGNPYAKGQSAAGAFGMAKPNTVDLGFKVINAK